MGWRLFPEQVLCCKYRAHATSVLQMTHMLISHPGGLRDLGVVDTVTLLACYIAAISHDYGHPGGLYLSTQNVIISQLLEPGCSAQKARPGTCSSHSRQCVQLFASLHLCMHEKPVLILG